MTQHADNRADKIENNANTVTGSTLNNSPVVAGSQARVRVSVGATPEDHQAAAAIDELRQALLEAQAAIDRRDDETRERLELAAGRLNALEEEMEAQKSKRDWVRVHKLMTGIRDALTGLSSLTLSADALVDAVTKVSR